MKYKINDVVIVKRFDNSFRNNRNVSLLNKCGIIVEIIKGQSYAWADYRINVKTLKNENLGNIWGVLESELDYAGKIEEILYG